jgi:lysophospholipase L1-like esterase
LSTVTTWSSYVALGDSFTEGMVDGRPDGTFRGWADRVAEVLAARAPGFRYANLAVRGRLFQQVVDEQVPAALAMKPDLVSFVAGGNDALRTGFDLERIADRLDRVVGELAAGGATVLMLTGGDPTFLLPGKRVVRPRAEAYNALIRQIAARRGALLADLWPDPVFADRRMWGIDRLHLNEYGHRRVAAHVLTALGLAPDPTWWQLPTPPQARSWAAARAADVAWVRQYLGPWVKRRLTGRSSGDGITAKRPTLTPLEAEL